MATTMNEAGSPRGAVVVQMPTVDEGQEHHAAVSPAAPSGRLLQKKWPAVLLFLAVAAIAGAVVVQRQRAQSQTALLQTVKGESCQVPVVLPVWPAASLARRDLEQGQAGVTLTAFIPPANASSGTSVVIAPGGSYYGVAVDVEGFPYARWLCAQGIASYVLDYRTAGNGYHSPLGELDARRALRTVRSRLRPLVDDSNKVGMIGSSAGGHLAATMLAYHDDGDAKATDPIERESSRPNFGLLVYPVITMEDGVAHAFSKTNLLGPGLTAEETQAMTEHYSIEKHVTHAFPPTFLYTFENDMEVQAKNSHRLERALVAAKVVHETAIYEQGMHGSGLGVGSRVTEDGELVNGDPWTTRCLAFLTRIGMLNATEA